MLIRYGCGCIGFPVDHPLTAKSIRKDENGNSVAVIKPCIVRPCDSDSREDYAMRPREINPENMQGRELSREEELRIWLDIRDLVCDGYKARMLKYQLKSIMA